MGSAICRIHTGQHPALFDATRHRSGTFSGCKLCPRRISEESEVKETIYCELATWRNGSHHERTASLLARLLGLIGPATVCSPWLCSVCRLSILELFIWIDTAIVIVLLTGGLDTIAYRYSTNTITQTLTLSRGSRY